MGKSGEGRGLFRRRSTPPEQDPTIDITSVLSGYGRTATLAPAPVQVVDDDTVRYTAEPQHEDAPVELPEVSTEQDAALADAPHDPVIDLTDDARTGDPEGPVALGDAENAEPEAIEPEAIEPEAIEPAGVAYGTDAVDVTDSLDPEPDAYDPSTVENDEGPGFEAEAGEAGDGAGAVDVDAAAALDLGANDGVSQDAGTPPAEESFLEQGPGPTEPVYASVGREIPPPAGWWEDADSGWGPADLDEIDAIVHGSLPSAAADQAPEPLSHEEAYGHHEDTAESAEPEDAGWAVAPADAVERHDAEEPVVEVVEAAAPVAWWQALQTDDLGGLPVAGPEQHDEQHLHHHEVHAEAVADQPSAPVEDASDPRPWWASLQDPAHDVPSDTEVVDLRDDTLSEEPEAVAARLARLRDAGLLSHEEYAAETAGLLPDRG